MQDMPTVVASENFIPEDEGKRRFARLLLEHPGDIPACAHNLAYSVGIFSPEQINNIAKYWPFDPVVTAEKDRLLAEKGGPDAFLPGKTAVGYALWKIADSNLDAETRIKALQEYSKLMDFHPKANQAPIVIVNKVMAIPMAESDDEWERRAEAQQRKLKTIEHQP